MPADSNPTPNSARSQAAGQGAAPTLPGLKPGADAANVSFVNDPVVSELVQNAVVDSMERYGYAKAARFAVRLALAEAIANAFHHGHETLPPSVPIQLSFRVGESDVEIAVEDQGPGFDPSLIPDPTLDENIERPCGRGLMLIKAYMTSVVYNAKGNRMTMTFQKNAQA